MIETGGGNDLRPLGRLARDFDLRIVTTEPLIVARSREEISPLMNQARHRNCLASRWMRRGFAAVEENSEASLNAAVSFFDHAIRLRRTLPLSEDLQFRYDLGGGWINRGDVLARLGGGTHLAEALNSYDEALDVLRNSPLRENPLFLRRVAITWTNRGIAWQRLARVPSPREDIRCFREALAVLENSSANAMADLLLLKAGVWSNLASAWLDEPSCSIAESCEAASRAISLVRNLEKSCVGGFEVGLKARQILCRSISHGYDSEALVSRDGKKRAMHAVSEAMALVGHWEQRGETRFRPVGCELFRFGCRLYQIDQPGRLPEFILKSLDSETNCDTAVLDPEMHDVALTALWQTLGKIQQKGFSMVGTPRFELLLSDLANLRAAEERLEQLRRTRIRKTA